MEILRYSRECLGKDGIGRDVVGFILALCGLRTLAFILFHIVYMKMVTAKAKGHG